MGFSRDLGKLGSSKFRTLPYTTCLGLPGRTAAPERPLAPPLAVSRHMAVLLVVSGIGKSHVSSNRCPAKARSTPNSLDPVGPRTPPLGCGGDHHCDGRLGGVHGLSGVRRFGCRNRMGRTWTDLDGTHAWLMNRRYDAQHQRPKRPMMT